MSTERTDLRGGVFTPSMIGLLLTQLLGAFNDNLFRWFAIKAAQTAMEESLALTVGIASFTLPYLIFAVPAGFLADRFSKRNVIVGCKVAEIVIMALGIGAIFTGNPWLLILVVGLMGTQSALFGPAKFGAIAELTKPEALSKANGVMGLVTVGASALGMFAAFFIFPRTGINLKETIELSQVFLPTLALVGVAIAGTLTSLLIRQLSPANPTRKIETGLVGAVKRDMKMLAANSALMRTALGIGFFWMMASFFQTNLDRFGPDILFLTTEQVGGLMLILVAGLGIGSVVAGYLSGDKVELGLVPVGALGITVSAICLFWSGQPVYDQYSEKVDGYFAEWQEAPEMAVELKAEDSNLEAALQKRIERKLSEDGVSEADVTSRSEVTVASASLTSSATAWYVASAWPCFWLFLLGLAAGFFDIPLEANIQHRSDEENRGTVLAATNFLSFAMILVGAGIYYGLNAAGLNPGHIFLFAGVVTLPVIVLSFRILPQQTIRFCVWSLSLLVYRIKVIGQENIPEKGGAILVANHVSWLDGILLVMVSDRPIRMIAYSDYVEVPGLRGWLCRTFGVIPINASDGPRALIKSLKTAQQAAVEGELVCIFAEGAITRTGQLQPFQRGIMRIADGAKVPVIPTYLDELWGSLFSFSKGKFFWKRPKRWPYPITILFGKPLHDADDLNEVRQAVERLGVQAVEHRTMNLIPARQFLRASRQARSRSKSADSSGMDITGGRLLTGSLVFRRVLQREFLAPDEKMVGVLLPPSVGGSITNAALALMGRVSVNLNYTLSEDVLNFCIKEAGIKHIITSKQFLEKKPLNLDAEWILVEDIKEKVTGIDKALCAFSAHVEPMGMLERRLGLTSIDPDDVMTIIFTSGSTGEPKGVMLSHNNVGSNIASANQLFQISEKDCLLGILPFFHSFGFTLMLWLPLTLEPKGVYHFNPLDGRTIGKLCEEHRVTIIAATPTFLKTYLKRCTKEQMQHVDLAIVGAEKLPESLANEFHEKFGIFPTEGYGTTELSPLAIANVPDHRNNSAGSGQTGTKMGSVGRPVPNVAARIVDPDTGKELGLNEAGLMHIQGPNVMLGYLNRPEKTAEVIKDGWYDTGDIAIIDDEGFITITGRLSRFSKIGGEMVPHIRIEEELNKAIEDPDSDDTSVKLAVTAVPDAKKGERLIVLHKPLSKPVDELINALSEAGLPNIWLPSADSFLEVDEIPLLGTGKLDLRGVKEAAMTRFGPQA
jgi:acyl-[acyl-carrier-protein]-phospholipid O-acyltransferase / long-chain-fatty-acid--[acyl-carrier-protein] ligase